MAITLSDSEIVKMVQSFYIKEVKILDNHLVPRKYRKGYKFVIMECAYIPGTKQCDDIFIHPIQDNTEILVENDDYNNKRFDIQSFRCSDKQLKLSFRIPESKNNRIITAIYQTLYVRNITDNMRGRTSDRPLLLTLGGNPRL